MNNTPLDQTIIRNYFELNGNAMYQNLWDISIREIHSTKYLLKKRKMSMTSASTWNQSIQKKITKISAETHEIENRKTYERLIMVLILSSSRSLSSHFPPLPSSPCLWFFKFLWRTYVFSGDASRKEICLSVQQMQEMQVRSLGQEDALE